MEKARLKYPVIVEGKYDKNTLKQIFDCTVISLDGFGVFNSKEKQLLVKKLAKDGIILLTDSDGGGKQIRSFLLGILPRTRVYNAYIPKIQGKERRKSAPSCEGYLGVEGMSREVLLSSLAPFIDNGGRVEKRGEKNAQMITKVDFFEHGLTGGAESKLRRARLAEHFGLPCDMTANALLEAINLLSDRAGYSEAVRALFIENAD